MQRADHSQAVEAARRWIVEHRPLPAAAGMGVPDAGAADHAHDQAALGLGAADAGSGRNGRLGPKRDIRKGRRLELLCALRRAREELGRWPTAGEWEFATSEHFSRRSYAREFGSWRRACRTAARLML
jgi:Homing endonuclease associated repeat